MNSPVVISDAALDRDGFEILEEPVSDGLVSELAAAAARFGDGPGTKPRAGLRNLLQDSAAIAKAARGHPLGGFARAVLGPAAFPVRGMLFDKHPGANWRVSWHQDLSIAVAERRDAPSFGGWSVKEGVPHVQPPVALLERMVTVRLHLDDCGGDNGALRVIACSHRHGRLTAEAISRWRRTDAETVCTLPRGGILLMRPLLLHASSAARQAGHRRVLHLEYAAEALPDGLRWFEGTEPVTSLAGPNVDAD